MRAYVVKPGKTIYRFDAQSVFRRKCNRDITQVDHMFFDAVMDPVMLANGKFPHPSEYSQTIVEHSIEAANRGYSVYKDEKDGVYVMVKYEDVRVF